MSRPTLTAAALAAMLWSGGCVYSERDDEDGNVARSAEAGAPAPAEPVQPPVATVLALEVDLAAREVRVYRGSTLVAAHPAAVGSSEWPTPTGEWTIGQVIFNPRWIPPEEEWAEGEEEVAPGDPENPLGRAQLVYDAPNSIHGTNEPESIGKPVSHGSIRVANDVAVALARMVMEAGGAARDSAWFAAAEGNRTQRQEVIIPNPVPIRVVNGDSLARPRS